MRWFFCVVTLIGALVAEIAAAQITEEAPIERSTAIPVIRAGMSHDLAAARAGRTTPPPHKLSEEAQAIRLGLAVPRPPAAPLVSLELAPGPFESRALPDAAILLAASFPGIDDNGFDVPDGALAAGPLHLAQMVNGSVQYFSKNGRAVGPPTSLNAFFGTADVFDPRVLFDPFSQRFIAAAASGGDPDPTNSLVHVAVSRSDDPTGDWCVLSLSGTDPAGTWSDFPMLGFNDQAIFVGTHQIGTGTVEDTSRLQWIDKAAMVACASPVTFYTSSGLTNCNDTKIFVAFPAQNFDPGAREAIATASASNAQFIVHYVEDPLGNPVIRKDCIDVGDFSPPPDALQPGGAIPLDTGDEKVQATVQRGGRLFTVSAAAAFSCPGAPGNLCSAMFFNEFGLSDLAVLQSVVYGRDGEFLLYPTMAVNSALDAVFSFTSSSTSLFPTAGAAGRRGTDPANAVRSEVALAFGTASYFRDCCDDLGRNRWGDYFGASVDTCELKGFWVEAQRATSDATWAKQIGHMFSDTRATNDECRFAKLIEERSYIDRMDATFATWSADDPLDSCAPVRNDGSVWYSVVVPTGGSVTVATFGSALGLDTVLSVYRDANRDCSALTEIGCSDDVPDASGHSQVTFLAQAGARYRIKISEYSFDTGTCTVRNPLVMTADITPQIPACNATTDIPPLGGDFTGTTTGVSTLAATCDADATSTAPEKVFRWTPPYTGRAAIATCGSSFDTVVSLRDGACDDPFVTTDCSDGGGCILPPSSSATLRSVVFAGHTYYIIVDGHDAGSGTEGGAFNLSVMAPLPGLRGLIEFVQESTDLGTAQALLLAWGQRALDRRTDAEALLAAGDVRAAKAKLKSALRRMISFEHRVHSLNGRRHIPEATRDVLLAISGPILAELRAELAGL